MLVIAAVGLWLSRRMSTTSAVQTITGKGFRATGQDIGRWRWAGFAFFVLFFLVAVALPILMLIWSSLLPGFQQPSVDALHRLTFSNYARDLPAPRAWCNSVKNSLITAVAAGVIVTVLAALVAYITVKTRLRGRGLLDGLATVPIAVPSVVMGVGILYWYLAAPLPFHLYGTLAILIVAFVTITLPYGMRYIVPGMGQIKDELEEAATASGAGWWQSFRRVFVPLLMPSLLAAFLYTMIVSFREVSAAIFLYSSGTEVVSVQVFDLFSNGSYPVVAALGVVLVLFLSILAGGCGWSPAGSASGAGESMIKLTGVVKRYRGRAVTANAVDGIDLDIPEGKLVTLLGPSGCGKTTTLRLIAGLERADAGVIEIGGQVVSDPARRVYVGPHRRPIGIVFQSYAIWPHMTVLQNVMFPLRGQPRRARPRTRPGSWPWPRWTRSA